jgi:ATP-binding cassette, subfamily B (MDR/TAP), member 1
MGDGLVLESGTHQELLANEQGPYFRLVEAQKLREAKNADAEERESDDGTLPEKEEGEDYGKLAKEEIPLGRVKTSQSLASEILAQRRQQAGENRVEYSMIYLFKRMAAINRDCWRKYMLGSIGAIRTSLFRCLVDID